MAVFQKTRINDPNTNNNNLICHTKKGIDFRNCCSKKDYEFQDAAATSWSVREARILPLVETKNLFVEY